MRILKHLPLDQWPPQDHAAFAAAYAEGDIFDETRGPGAHLSAGSRLGICTSWRRWLGYLHQLDPDALILAPAERITPERVRAFIGHIRGEMLATSVAIVLGGLYRGVRVIASDADVRWLRALVTRLEGLGSPQDRFDRLVPPWEILDHAYELMDAAMRMECTSHHGREIQYRGASILALLSHCPIRRRSLAALTVSRHVLIEPQGITLRLFPEDMKERNAISWAVPDDLLPYFNHYLAEIRPRFPGADDHDGLWASCQRCPLTAGHIYIQIGALTKARFGKAMALHDFRRAAATFLAMESPELVGIIPGVLQHNSPDSSEHYKLARAVQASRRVGATMAGMRDRLRPLPKANKD